MTKLSPFRYFKTSPEITRLAVMMYVRFPLSLRNLEDLLHERGIDISHGDGPLLVAALRPLFDLLTMQRSLYSGSKFKQNRVAALAEWRGLCVA